MNTTRVRLVDVAELFDGPHATPKPCDDGPVFLGIGNITPDGRLDLSDIRYISEDEFPKWTRRVLPRAGDIVFTYEATLHRYALIPETFRGCLGRRTALLRTRDDTVDPRFLLYYFLSPSWRAQVERNVWPGATVERIPLTKVPDFALDLPSIEDQKMISERLGTIDELIANNERRIALLEESVHLLYREWFERRRFPGHEWTQITDGVPAGWTKQSFGDLANLVNDRVKPHEVDATTPYVGLEHIPRRCIALSEWGHASDVTSSKLRFLVGDVLFGKIRPYFHKVVISAMDGITSSDTLVLRAADPDYAGLVLAVASSVAFVEHASSTAKVGTNMPRADWRTMASFRVVVPPASLAREFTALVRDRTDMLGRLVLTNRKLRETRDYLLPRLMSGRLAA